jgi:hypothetical protein
MTLTSGPQHSIGRRRFEYNSNSNYFKTFQTLTDPKTAFPSLNFFEIKHGFEALKKMDNFLHRKFFRFGMEFK